MQKAGPVTLILRDSSFSDKFFTRNCQTIAEKGLRTKKNLASEV